MTIEKFTNKILGQDYTEYFLDKSVHHTITKMMEIADMYADLRPRPYVFIVEDKRFEKSLIKAAKQMQVKVKSIGNELWIYESESVIKELNELAKHINIYKK